jgi:hypothetical protein
MADLKEIRTRLGRGVNGFAWRFSELPEAPLDGALAQVGRGREDPTRERAQGPGVGARGPGGPLAGVCVCLAAGGP